MRATILTWFLGLISVSFLAGCSLFDKNGCEKCGTSGGPIRSRLAGSSSKKQDATASAKVKLTQPADIVQTSATAEPDTVAAPGQETSGLPYKVEYIPATSTNMNSQKIVKGNTRQSVNTQMDPTKEQNIVIQNTSFKYGHGANFETVTGQVQTFRKTVRLRYASIEQEDPYGGVVILEGADVSQLRDGQHVRVQGAFVAPSDRNGSATYRVHAVEILD